MEPGGAALDEGWVLAFGVGLGPFLFIEGVSILRIGAFQSTRPRRAPRGSTRYLLDESSFLPMPVVITMSMTPNCFGALRTFVSSGSGMRDND